MKHISSPWPAVIVFCFSLFLFFLGAGSSSIYILDESKNAQCAYEMMTTNGITPVFNGELRTDKPPLHYYFMMLAYTIAGKTPAAARFFSAVTGSILMMVFFLFLKHHSFEKHAWWTLLVLWSSIHFVLEFHLAVPDPYLITCVGISLMAFYHWIQTRKKWALYGIYLFLGLGVLAKGPVALALPGLSMLVYLIVTRQFSAKILQKLISVSGILLFLAVILPWYSLVWHATKGEWLKGFLLDHNINRFSDTKEGHGGFFLITIGYYLMGFLPFVFFIGPVVKSAWQNRRDHLILFGVIITLVFVVFFSVSSTKLPNYPMPAYPFTAILVGDFLAGHAGNIHSLKYRWHFLAVFLFTILLMAGVFIAVETDPNLKGLHKILWYLLPLSLGALIAVLLAFKAKNKYAFLTLGITFSIGAMFLTRGFMPRIDKRNPVYLTTSLMKNADSLAWHQSLNPAFVFKYGIIPELQGTAEIESYLSEPGNLLLTTEKGIKQLQGDQVDFEVLFECTDLFDKRKTRIIRGTVGWQKHE
jgi:4-amino-4-deoxy-L-arabinose transferase-like glycosyltransferase